MRVAQNQLAHHILILFVAVVHSGPISILWTVDQRRVCDSARSQIRGEKAIWLI